MLGYWFFYCWLQYSLVCKCTPRKRTCCNYCITKCIIQTLDWVGLKENRIWISFSLKQSWDLIISDVEVWASRKGVVHFSPLSYMVILFCLFSFLCHILLKFLITIDIRQSLCLHVDDVETSFCIQEITKKLNVFHWSRLHLHFFWDDSI